MFSRLRRSRSAASRPKKTPSARQERSTCSKSSLVPTCQWIKRENETEFGATFRAFLALLACYCTKLFSRYKISFVRSKLLLFCLNGTEVNQPRSAGQSNKQLLQEYQGPSQGPSPVPWLIWVWLAWNIFLFLLGGGGNVSWHVLHKEGKMINVNKSAESRSCDDAETSTF